MKGTLHRDRWLCPRCKKRRQARWTPKGWDGTARSYSAADRAWLCFCDECAPLFAVQQTLDFEKETTT